MSNVIYLPQDIRSVHAMRNAINERAKQDRANENKRLHGFHEGLRLMCDGRSSAAAVALGWKVVRGPREPFFSGSAA
jgi:hypothetical protein